MNNQELNRLMQDKQYLDFQIGYHLKTKVVFPQEIKSGEILGHIEKAEHNLNFVKDNSVKYSDWAIVGCYYAAYHIAMALLLKKGFFSKSHDATLCLLIKHYYNLELSAEDFELLNNFYLDTQDIQFYVESKLEREKASYSSQIVFDKTTVNTLQFKTILFVNKCKEILK